MSGTAARAMPETLSEIPPPEHRDRRRGDRREIGDRVGPQPEPEVLRAAERAELDDRARGAGDVGGELAESVLVERLEGQQPGGGGRDVGERPGAERLADLAEQARGEARAEDHEDR